MAKHSHEPRAVDLRFKKDRLIVELDDDRAVSVPLSFYPTLQNARPAQRRRWRLIGDGRGISWESLDLDLSVQGLINGMAEAIPRPPVRLGRRRGLRKAMLKIKPKNMRFAIEE